MLKFLRKYNTWILVVAGSLLIVAWLLGETISQLGKMQAQDITIKVNGVKASRDDIAKAYSEYSALSESIGRNVLGEALKVENATHWYLLSREATEAGLVGGPTSGKAFVPVLARELFSGMFGGSIPPQFESQVTSFANEWQTRMDVAAAKARLSAEDASMVFAKLQGVGRLRTMTVRSPRFSDRRLTAGFKKLEDTASIDYVFIPADREVPSVDKPSDDAITAFFNQHKDVKPGEGEFGVGYKLPERVKLEWMTLNLRPVQDAIEVDPIEVQKRFLRKYPDGKPTDNTPELAKQAIADELRDEQLDRIVKAADQAVRSEVDKTLRGLVQDGRYYTLPADYASTRPTLEKLRDAIAQRVKDSTGVTITPPTIERRQSEWLTKTKLGALEGLGRSLLQRGDKSVPFVDVALKVKELAGSNDAALQANLPSEPLTDAAGNRYYFVITDVRKESAPDTIEEVRADIIRDMMQIEGFRRLQAKVDALRASAASGGLEAVAKAVPAEGQQVVSASDLPVNNGSVKYERVSGAGINRADVDDAAFREAVVKAAAALDPTKPLDSVPSTERIVAVALPKTRGVAVAKITGLNPVTVDRYRAGQYGAVRRVLDMQSPLTKETDPYSYANMVKRLKVELPKGENEPGEGDETATPAQGKDEPAKSA